MEQRLMRMSALRTALIKHNLWTEESVDKDVLPSITTEEDLREYEEIVAMEIYGD